MNQRKSLKGVIAWGLATLITAFFPIIAIAIGVYEEGILQPEMFSQKPFAFLLTCVTLVATPICGIGLAVSIVKFHAPKK